MELVGRWGETRADVGTYGKINSKGEETDHEEKDG
jgi:hypothetical protein